MAELGEKIVEIESRISILERTARTEEDQRYRRWEKYDKAIDEVRRLESKYDEKIGILRGEMSQKMETLIKQMHKLELEEGIEAVKNEGKWGMLSTKLGWVIAILLFVLMALRLDLSLSNLLNTPGTTTRGQKRLS